MKMIAELITIGNEITTGQIADTNSAWIARQLLGIGVEVKRMVSVEDRLEDIVKALEEASSRARLVIVTGGLGPTFDDLTRAAAARFARVELERFPAAVSHLIAWFQSRDRPLTPENLCQADLPSSSEILENTQGTAPGFTLSVAGGEGNSRCASLFFLPGVPQEMEAMYLNAVLPRLRRILPGDPVPAPFTIRLFGIWESEANKRLSGEFSGEEKKQMAIRATGGVILVTVYSPAGGHIPDRLRRLFRDVSFGEGSTSLADALVDALQERGATVAIAESCTGGLIASQLTSVPGASKVFGRGWVVYSDQAKMELLDVPPVIIQAHGAVSEPVARALAEGALERARSDVAISVTGIAGPGGGTPSKPVGLVWFGAARRDGPGDGPVRKTVAFYRKFNGPRSRIQLLSANTALDLARRAITRSETFT